MIDGGSEFRRAWTVILAAAVGVGSGITGLPIYSIGQFILPLSHTFGWSRAAISGGLGCLTAVSVFTAPVVGYVIDRFGARRVALFALPGAAVGYICLASQHGSLVAYYAGWIVLAILGAGTSPNVWTRVVAGWFDRHRGLALGLTLCGTGLVAIVAPAAIGGTIRRFGWQYGFLALAAVQIVVAFPVVWGFFHTREAGGAALAPKIRTAGTAGDLTAGDLSAGDLSLGRQFWQIIVAFFLIAIVVAGMIVHLPAMLGDIGVSGTRSAEVLGLLGVAVIGGRLVVGFLLDRLPVRLIAPIFIVMPIGSCLLLLNGGAIAVAVVLSGLATGAEVDILPYLVSRYFGVVRYSRVYGWVLSAFSAGAAIGPVAAGWVHDTSGHYTAALFCFMVLAMIGASLIATLGAPPRFELQQ
jgi:MFS family permease